MSLRLTLSSYGSSTLEIGLAIDDAGHVTGWQTGGWRVGRFARDLSAEEQEDLNEALEAARSATAASTVGGTAPSGATEQLVVEGLPDATFASSAEPPAGFEELVRVLREVREDLAEFPVGAIELDVAAAPVRLRHVGSEPIGVRSNGAIRVEVVAYDKDYLEVGREVRTIEVAAFDGEVSAGWELELGELSLAAPQGGFLSLSVGPLRVDSVGDGVLRQAEFSWVSE